MLRKLSRLPKSYLSTVSSRTNTTLTDWQYVQRIHQSLKKKNINEALSYLINSNLNEVILDKQTFYNTHHKMKELKTCISYQQLAYKLYREYFTPCLLMVQWMNMISGTKNEKLRATLIEDFKKLNIQMPQISKQNNESKQKNQKKQSKRKSGKQIKDGNEAQIGSLEINQKPISPIVSIQPTNPQKETNQQLEPQQQAYKPLRKVAKPRSANSIPAQEAELPSQLPTFPNQLSQLTQMMKILQNIMKQKGVKIVFNNIQIQTKDMNEDDEDFNHDDDDDQVVTQFEGTDDEKALKMMEYLLQTLKISIGKLEITIEGDKINISTNEKGDGNGDDGKNDGKDGGNSTK